MKQHLFSEMEQHLLEDAHPSVYLQKQLDEGSFGQPPYTIFGAMEKTEQNPDYHPEGNVFAHTLLVVDEAAKRRNESRNPRVFMWAALLHDVGKPETTKWRKGKLTAYDHDIAGAVTARRFLEWLTDEQAFIDRVVGLVRFHMQPFFTGGNRPWSVLDKLATESDYREVALLGLCDRLGRHGVDEANERQRIERFVVQMEELLTRKT